MKNNNCMTQETTIKPHSLNINGRNTHIVEGDLVMLLLLAIADISIQFQGISFGILTGKADTHSLQHV